MARLPIIFTESGRPFRTPISAQTLTALDATGCGSCTTSLRIHREPRRCGGDRDKLIEMVAQWYVEAGKYNVLPVDGRGQERFAEERPVIAKDRTRYTYYRGTQEVSSSAAPRILNSPTINALVDIPEEGAEGVLVSQGGIDGGFTVFIQDSRLRYTYNYVADQHFEVVSDTNVPSGPHALSFEFEPTGEAQPQKGMLLVGFSVELELPPDGVADPSFGTSQRFSPALAFVEFASEYARPGVS